MSSFQAAVRHLYFRWFGAVLLVSGLFLFLKYAFAIFDIEIFIKQLLSLVTCVFALATFGVNHDTAIAYALKAHNEGESLSTHPALEQELKEDLDRDRAETMSLKPHSILSYLIPCIALVLQGYLWSTVFNS